MNKRVHSWKNTMTDKLKCIRGSVMILIAPMLIVFFALSVLTVDLSRIFVIRNQLQNAADAVALHAASYFYPSASGGGPNWTLVQSEATNALPYNKVDGLILTNLTSAVGYWDLTGSNSSLLDTSTKPTANNAPGIKITISKSTGNNGGPITTFFGAVVGIPTVNVSAHAIAVAASPNGVPANTLFPLGVAQSLYNSYWDSNLQKPKIDPATGQPYIFHINEGSEGGWSTFSNKVNDTPTIISLIQSGNPTSLSVGQSVWISNGVKTAIYDSVPTNKDVVVTIIADTSPGSMQPIAGFGALHIDFGVGGSGKYIQAHFIKDFKLPATILGGVNYGVYAPAKLVN